MTFDVVLTQMRRGNYLQNHYETKGPDGQRFTHYEKADFKRVLARCYGLKIKDVDLRIDDQRQFHSNGERRRK